MTSALAPVCRSLKGNALLLPAFAFLIVVFVVPLAGIFFTAFQAPHFSYSAFRDVFSRPVYLKVILNTFEISLLSTVLTAVVGYPIAYLIHESPQRLRRVLYGLVMMSFWVSMIVRSFAWITILGRTGIVGYFSFALGEYTDHMLYNTFSVVVGMANVLLPFMILPILGSMDSISGDLLRAGETLGARRGQVFRRIFVPLSLPGLAAGCLLVFVLSLGFYITPTLLGGPSTVMVSQIISMEVSETLNWPVAAAISSLLLIVTFGGVLIFNKLLGLDRLFS